MKILLLALPLAMIAVGCNKDADKKFEQQREEVNTEYNEKLNEANQERNEAIQDAREESREEMQDAREDLNEVQKEEAVEYVEDADRAIIDKSTNEVKVEEPAAE